MQTRNDVSHLPSHSPFLSHPLLFARIYIYISPSIFVIVYPSSSSYSATPEDGVVNQNRRVKKSLSVYANYRGISGKKKKKLRNGARSKEREERKGTATMIFASK